MRRNVYDFMGRRYVLNEDLESIISADRGMTWRPTTVAERVVLLLLIWFKP